MFGIFNKKEIVKPDSRCKIDITLENVNQGALSKLPTNGNTGLDFIGSQVIHKKHGHIGDIPPKKLDRLSKLGNYQYYWNVFDRYEDNDDASIANVIGKGLNIKIY